MAYQNPSFVFLHAAADTGVGNMTENATVDSSYPETNLVDYRPSSLFAWSNAVANHHIKVDRGSAGLEVIDTLIIPDGHNMNAAEYELRHNTSDSWGGTKVLDTSFGSGVVYETFTESSERWWRLEIQTSGAWELPQLWLGRTRTPSIGPDPNWNATKVSSLLRVPFPSRESSLSVAPLRWRYVIRYNAVSGTDLDIFDELISETGGGLVPFYFIPLDDGDDPLLVSLQGYTRAQDGFSPSGSAGATYRIELDMLEQIG